MIFRLLQRILVAAVAATVVAGFVPALREAAVAAYAVFLGVVAAAELVPALARVQGGQRRSAFEAVLARRPGRPERPEELVRLENQVTLAVSLAGDVHARLRPLLAEVVAHRLGVRHGLDLERDADAARALLGQEAWELVRPDASPPADRFASGIPPARLARVLDAVEAL
ncbi:MAG: hypothetical protein ICV64_11890 [Thermoleophilia bacterium]|nr:hypothetical protein [Thermoleophilia bacterium]